MSEPRGNCFCYGDNKNGQPEMYDNESRPLADKRLHISDTSQQHSLCNRRVRRMAGLRAGSPDYKVCSLCVRKDKERQTRVPRKLRDAE